MKKALVLLVLGLMMGVLGHGQNSFIHVYDTAFIRNHFNDVAILNNGTYACTGWASNSNGAQIPVVLYSSSGAIVKEWRTNSQFIYNYASAIASNQTNGFAVAGVLNNAFGIINFNSAADSTWSYRHPTLGFSKAYAIANTNDNGYVAAGYEEIDTINSDILIIKVNASGDTVWTVRHGFANVEFATDIVLTSDGGYLICGETNSHGSTVGYYNPFALKLDSTGIVEWYKYYQFDVLSRITSMSRSFNGGYLIVTRGTYNTWQSYLTFISIDSIGDTIATNHLISDPFDLITIRDIEQTSDSNYILTGSREINSIKYLWISKLNQQFDTIWNQYYGGTFPNSFSQGLGIEESNDKGFVIACQWEADNGAIIKTDSLGRIPTYYLKGVVVADMDSNCNLGNNENYLSNQVIQASTSQRYLAYTNNSGEYFFKIYDAGAATLSYVAPSSFWESSYCMSSQVPVVLSAEDTVVSSYFLQPLILCPDLTVSLNTPFLRRCFQNNYTVNYCNNGTLPANSAYIEIEMDPYLTVDSASIPWALPQQGNLYRFNVDTVGIGQCSSFNLWVTVDCDSTELGQTHCVSAHIYPDSICLPPDPAWDGSSVAVSGSCGFGDTLDLKIENVGSSDMTSPSFFLIAEDNVMYNSGNFQLQSGDSLKFRFKGNGSTFTLLADQVEGHPGRSFPMVSIEGCGVNNQGTFSTGFVTQYPQDDQNGYVDVICLQNIGAFDPNDKRPEPLGLDNEGYITATQPLDYTIRFQNTGTDTAFTVVLRDTLSPYLDITTLYLTGASHPYTFQIIGSNVLEWTFANILLPDSNVNEPLSHGFVSFHINQVAGNTVGTEITNRAGIYFDFNAPVITNTTLNTVIADYKTWFTFVQSPESTLALGIYPNPNNGTFSLDFEAKPTANYKFAIYDLAGAKQFGQTLTGKAPYVLQPDLPTGMYIYQLLENGTAVGMGKVVVNR